MNHLTFFKYTAILGMIFWALGCEPEEPECVPSGIKKVVEVEKTPLPKSETNRLKDKMDFCKACARSPKGFFSCQTAYAKSGESRTQLREQAKQKACKDAGFPEGACPDKAILLQQCKGDEKDVKPTALSNAMKDLLQKQTKGVSHTSTEDTTVAPKSAAPESNVNSATSQTTSSPK